MHLHALVADSRNIIVFQLRTGIFRRQAVHDPLYNDVVRDNESIAVKEALRGISLQNGARMQPRCHMFRQLIIAISIQNAVGQVIKKSYDIAGLIGYKALPLLRHIAGQLPLRRRHKHNRQ